MPVQMSLYVLKYIYIYIYDVVGNNIEYCKCIYIFHYIFVNTIVKSFCITLAIILCKVYSCSPFYYHLFIEYPFFYIYQSNSFFVFVLTLSLFYLNPL